METANEIMKQVVPILMIPVNRYLRYLILCATYVRVMSIKITELNAARVSVEEHMTRNNSSHREIPAEVSGWLEDVEKIYAKVENVPSDVGGCFNLKIRHRAGRNAFDIIEEIDSVMRRHSLITWPDRPIPLGRVVSTKTSISTPSIEHGEFQSREVTFAEALKALGPNHEGYMVALCGMGGVGKTTMMNMLKDVLKKKKMFNYIVTTVIGEKTDPIAIQNDVAEYLGIELSKSTKLARADKIRKWFEDNSDGGKNKFLIILDDVWESVNLEDIGLSTNLRNQGVNFKVLLTSRKRDVCTEMGVEASLILNVKVLEETEAQNLFFRFVGTVDRDLHHIGEDIVRKCCGLPIAITTMALTLRSKSQDSWKEALSRLVDHDIETVGSKVFDISYRNLQDEEAECIFLLCGLFPEDFDIPMEKLLRYGWGLNLFKKVSTIRRARTRLHVCIERLMDSNLLIESNVCECVKMHDLVRAFVLNMYSKPEHASIVNHGGMSGWSENNMSGSCRAISLTCKGMSEFPTYLNKFPNLSILKLMHGDKSLRFPSDFDAEMDKLQVLSYDKMKYPLTPSSPQCSTNLRVLHLHECSLIFDCSSIGNLLNLEVLSFANSGIRWLPSTIGNLKKLKLMDLTNCNGLHIDSGVFKNLVKLEELYMITENPINLTDENCNEMVERSRDLFTFEFEFFQNNSFLQKNMSFEKLERFKISMGCSLGDQDSKSRPSYENTLQLLTNRRDLINSRVNELFDKTEVLNLNVGDVNCLEELVEVKFSHLPQFSPFYNLKVLVMTECTELRFLFTIGVAHTLSKLEHLQVCECHNMEELVHTGVHEKGTITFPELKVLYLCGLPKLLSFCRNVDKIELPQLVGLHLEAIPGFTSIYPDNKLETSSFFNDEVVVPELGILRIEDMENLKQIWPCELRTSDQKVNLKDIQVINCNILVNIFPCNPMSLLHDLEEIIVEKCDSIEVLFDIDLDSTGEIGEGSKSCSLRSIYLENLEKLRNVWRIKGENKSRVLTYGFQAVESITIQNCKRFRNFFTPISINFVLGALTEISIDDCGENWRNNRMAESSQLEEQIKVPSKEERSEVGDSIPHIFSSDHMRSFHNLSRLSLSKFEGVGVVFEIESLTSKELVITQDNLQLPYLQGGLDIDNMKRTSHTWKCSQNRLLIIQKEPLESPFHNLTTIMLYECKNIKYLISSLTAKILSNLKEVKIDRCDSIEELFANRDNEHQEKTTYTSTPLFPHLESLTLSSLINLKCIGGGGCANSESKEILLDNSSTSTTTAILDQFKLSELSEAGDHVSWSLCQYSRKIDISYCNALSSVVPCYAAGQMQKLQVLRIQNCNGMKEVFETDQENIKSNNKSGSCDDGNGAILRPNNGINMLQLVNLRQLDISYCHSLEYVFTFSALKSLRRLEEFKITRCHRLKVIVKKEEDDGEQITTEESSSSSSKEVVVFPRLKSIEIDNLPELVGFFLGMNEFRWPSLDKVIIKDCPQMMVFAPGGSTAPELKYMHTSLGKHNVEECGLNFHMTTAAQNASSSAYPTTLEEMLWCFHNLIEIHLRDFFNLYGGDKIILSNALLKLEKLEKIDVSWCSAVKEVFEALGAGTNSTSNVFDESQTTVVRLPNLTQAKLKNLNSLRYIWKSNQWTIFEFPNLTIVKIERCDSLEHVFTSSMFGSLLQLQDLHISKCGHMEEVIVKDENVVVQPEESYGKMNVITLPRLKCLTLDRLPRLKGFWLGKEDFSLPMLDTLIIRECPEITVFTNGNLATLELKEIGTTCGSFYVAGEDINTFIKIPQEEFKKQDLYQFQVNTRGELFRTLSVNSFSTACSD